MGFDDRRVELRYSAARDVELIGGVLSYQAQIMAQIVLSMT
jgi:hypothetical protein